MWRTLKFTPEWLGSSAQVPGASGRAVSVALVVMVSPFGRVPVGRNLIANMLVYVTVYFNIVVSVIIPSGA